MMLDLAPGVSRFQVCLSMLAYGAGFSAVWVSDIPFELQLALSLAVGVAAVAHWYQEMGDYPNRIVRLFNQGSNPGSNQGGNHAGGWWLYFADGRIRKVELVGESVVLPWVVSLKFSEGQRRYALAVFRDSVTATEHRQLRAKVSMSEIALPEWQLTVTRWYQDGIRRMRRG